MVRALVHQSRIQASSGEWKSTAPAKEYIGHSALNIFIHGNHIDVTKMASSVREHLIASVWLIIHIDDVDLLCDVSFERPARLGAELHFFPRLCSSCLRPLHQTLVPSIFRANICWPRLSTAAPYSGGDHVDSCICTGLLQYHCRFPSISFNLYTSPSTTSSDHAFQELTK